MRPALMNPRLNGGAEGEDSTVDLGTAAAATTKVVAAWRTVSARMIVADCGDCGG